MPIMKDIIPNSAKQSDSKAQANGHKIILCTGRQLVRNINGDLATIDYDAIRGVRALGAVTKVGETILDRVCLF
ncbi:hypothetical protein [Dubosiella newyorkensis]|uniref:hypothetical protein n=1 Tax=Dubosiella newyorkensis TaxID=1862672 RepID=UPI003F6685E2